MPRVIAGEARGVRLVTPKSVVRPTLDRVREAVFSILQSRLPGARFLDLYAGSGANGIEALSRGAAWCALVDSDSAAIDAIGENVFRSKLGHKCRTYKLTLPEGLGVITKTEAPFDIIYCDPPYDSPDYTAVLSQIKTLQLVAPDGTVLLEHDSRNEFSGCADGFSTVRVKKHGRVGITIFA